MRRYAPLLVLVVLGVVLLATAVPAAFSIDENNYLATLRALRAGSVFLPGTATLGPSPELYAFDPNPPTVAPPTATASDAPPLYAFFALPFSYFGWLGLVALNTLSFLACALVVYALARRMQASSRVAGMAALLFVGGSYSIEYAQGVWPHMLSVLLCTAAFALTAVWRDEARAWAAFAAGLLVGLASGVRYQNIALAMALGLGLITFGPSRWRGTAFFSLGLALPLSLSSLINHERQASWVPVSKRGSFYLHVGAGDVVPGAASAGVHGQHPAGSWLYDTLLAFYAKVIDFSAHPALGMSGPDKWHWKPDPDVGVFLAGGAEKKALLQSAPWMIVALVVVATAWLTRTSSAPRATRELRAMSLVIGSVLAVFASAGVVRHDGLCFNQRYLLELLPLGAVATAIYASSLRASSKHWLVGTAAGAVLAAAPLLAPLVSFVRAQGLRLAPLLLVLCLLVAMWMRVIGQAYAEALLAALISASAVYALAVHLGDDLPASRFAREANGERASRWAPLLPERSALFVYWGAKDASAPLHLDRDLLVVDPWIDSGHDAPRLVDQLLAAGRRVFVDRAVMPDALYERIRGAHGIAVRSPGDHPVVEILRSTP